jgi:carbonic anhydrase
MRCECSMLEVLVKQAMRVLVLPVLAVLCASQLVAQLAEHQGNTPGPSADKVWSSLADGNKRFVEGRTSARDLVSQRHTLEKTQHPLAAVLSCSDSRVPPEVVFDQGLGEIFVVRVAGNSADPLAIGSLEYAVEHLGTIMIIVLGHQSCGAVTAACSEDKMPTPNLEAVVQPISQSCSVAKTGHTGASLVDFAIRDHVQKTVQDLLAHSSILRHAHDEGKLTIVEAYYSLDSGAVTKLK